MKCFIRSLSAAKGLTVLILAGVLAGGAQAASILTLEGETPQAKYETDAGIRLSVIDWSAEAQREAVENAWRQYRQDNDLSAFLAVLEAQDTRGYLFTAAATGYRIKYAWQEETGDSRMMHFLVMPGLKTRNPYLWNSPNNTAPEFTLVQVRLDNDSGVAKTSLDGDIVVNEAGRLALDGFDAVNVFATLEDSTPYYLK